MKNKLFLLLASFLAVAIMFSLTACEDLDSVLNALESMTEETYYAETEAETSSVTQAENKSADQSETQKYTDASELHFRTEELLQRHYQKHGKEMGFSSQEEYEEAAALVVVNPSALHKTEKEDGDDVYYIEKTNEFVIVSSDGYIRTYFNPDSGIKYYNKQ